LGRAPCRQRIGALTMIARMPHIDDMPAHDVDGVLHDFFRAEMPKPWPQSAALEEPAPPRLLRKRVWSRNTSRWALAASIALLVAGYLTLAGSFSNSAKTGLGEGSWEIGSKPKIRRDTTPNGRPVEVLEIKGRIDVRYLQTPDSRR